jgi:hypothetical protein
MVSDSRSACNKDVDPSFVPSTYHESFRLDPVPRFGTKFPGRGTIARSAFRVTMLTVLRHRSRARGDVEPAAERDLAGRRRSVVRVRHEAPRAPGGKESDAR